MEQIIDALSKLLVAVMVAGISALAAIASTFFLKLRKKAEAETAKLQNEAEQTFYDNIIATTYDKLSICIDKMEVTIVKELKNVSEDGKLTLDDQKQVADKAVSLFKEFCDQEFMDALKSIVGDTEKYLITLVDSVVLEKKNDLLKNGVNPAVTTDSVSAENALLS